MSFIVEKFRAWRLGGVTGLNATENNLKMTGFVVLPFLVMWIFIRMFLPDELYDMAVTASMFLWLAYVAMLWAWAKADASGYIPFPQSKWKFPDGACRTFDLKVPPDSWEKIATLPDGRGVYKVYFTDKYIYQDPDLPYPDVFDMAYWFLPARDWDTAFQRRAYGEFFHKGVFVTHPACEDISVYVLDWETKEGERFPICLINDCAETYSQALEVYRKPSFDEAGINQADGLWALYSDGRKREDKLVSHIAYLETRLEVAEKDHSLDYKKSADARLEAIRKRHASIMETKPPLFSRIFNLKTLAYVILLLAFIYIFGRLVLGVW